MLAKLGTRRLGHGKRLYLIVRNPVGPVRAKTP
jgi:hypothetical protein